MEYCSVLQTKICNIFPDDKDNKDDEDPDDELTFWSVTSLFLDRFVEIWKHKISSRPYALEFFLFFSKNPVVWEAKIHLFSFSLVPCVLGPVKI